MKFSSCPDGLEEDGYWSKVMVNYNCFGLSGLWFFKSSLVSKSLCNHRFHGYGCGCMKVRFIFWDLLNSFCSSEYLEYVTGPLCVPFLEHVGKIGMDLLNPSLHKRDAVLQKVQECLVGMAERGQQRRRHHGGGESHHLHEFFTHPSAFFWGLFYCFNFIVSSLSKPFYSLLSNFPWLHACSKVYSWNVTADQDSLELTSLHLECSLAPSSASPSRAVVAQGAPWERCWYQEDFVISAVWELQHSPIFRGKLVLWCSCGYSCPCTQYQLYNPQCFGSCLRSPLELSSNSKSLGPLCCKGPREGCAARQNCTSSAGAGWSHSWCVIQYGIKNTESSEKCLWNITSWIGKTKKCRAASAENVD